MLFLIRHLGKWFAKGLYFSLKLERIGFEQIDNHLDKNQPVIIAVWHGDMLMPWVEIGPYKPAAIVSLHSDGDFASTMLVALGFSTFRGSSNKGGREAFSKMMRHVKKMERPIAAFAVDGPKGPRRVMKPGILSAARLMKGVIIPVTFSAEKIWRASRSWDKFVVPKPFSRAKIVFGEASSIPENMSVEEQEKFLLSISNKFAKEQLELEHEMGHTFS